MATVAEPYPTTGAAPLCFPEEQQAGAAPITPQVPHPDNDEKRPARHQSAQFYVSLERSNASLQASWCRKRQQFHVLAGAHTKTNNHEIQSHSIPRRAAGRCARNGLVYRISDPSRPSTARSRPPAAPLVAGASARSAPPRPQAGQTAPQTGAAPQKAQETRQETSAAARQPDFGYHPVLIRRCPTRKTDAGRRIRPPTRVCLDRQATDAMPCRPIFRLGYTPC